MGRSVLPSAPSAYPGNSAYLLSCQYMATHRYSFLFDFVFQYHRKLSMCPKIPRLPRILQLQMQMFEISAGSYSCTKTPPYLGRFQFLFHCHCRASRHRMAHCTSWLTWFEFLFHTLLSMLTRTPTATLHQLRRNIVRKHATNFSLTYSCYSCKQYGLCRHSLWWMSLWAIPPNLKHQPHGTAMLRDSTLHSCHWLCILRHIVTHWKVRNILKGDE